MGGFGVGEWGVSPLPATAPAAPYDLVATSEVRTVAGAWLASLRSENTRAAYRRDLTDFLSFTDAHGVDVLAASRPVIDAYATAMETDGKSPATIARRLSALASFYRYLVDEGVLAASPVDRVRRPRVGTESPRLGLDRDEARAFLAAAEAAGPVEHALGCLLLLNGLRVSEATAAQVIDLDTERGHWVLRIVGKGGARRVTPLAPRTIAAVDALVDGRDTGPILLTDRRPLDRHTAARMIARVARRAGIDKRISPHSLRHTMVTQALEAGVPIHVVQDAAGHASPETTRRYDRARHQLDGHATYQLAHHLLG